MGLTVSMEDERGKRLELLEDPQGALARILPSPASTDSSSGALSNDFGYATANPANNTDSSGYCDDPKSGATAPRYCIGAFIPGARDGVRIDLPFGWALGPGDFAGDNRGPDAYGGSSRVELRVDDEGALTVIAGITRRNNADGTVTEKRAAPTCGSSGGAYFCIARDPLVDYAAPLAFVVVFDDQGQPHVQGTFYPSLEIWRYDDDARLVFSHDARFNPLGFLHLYQFGPLANQARYQ